MAFFRLVIFGGLILTVIYLVLLVSARLRLRRELRAEWEDAGRPGSRQAYIRAGLQEYNQSLRRWMLLGVFIIPVSAVMVIIYVVNFM